MKRRWSCSLMVLVMLAVACTTNTVFHRFLPLQESGWNRSDTVTFDLAECRGLEHGGLMCVELRTLKDFPYENLWLAVEQCDSDAHVLHKDTVRIRLADSDGRLCGKGVSLLEYSSAPVACVADSAGIASVRVWHLMSHELIPGLSDIGVCIVRE